MTVCGILAEASRTAHLVAVFGHSNVTSASVGGQDLWNLSNNMPSTAYRESSYCVGNRSNFGSNCKSEQLATLRKAHTLEETLNLRPKRR